MHTKNRQSKEQQLRNASYIRWSRLAVAQHLGLKTWRANVKLFCVLTLLPLALSLPGCSPLPRLPSAPPEPLPRPALTEPLPSVSYSLSAQALLRSWQKSLIGTSRTFAPSSTPLEKD